MNVIKGLTLISSTFLFLCMKILISFINAIMNTPKAIRVIPHGIFRSGKDEEEDLDRLEF